ncbi:DUF6538 domain-containing protein, partial [Acetobacter persici]|uniref:DUF6538 domain-containing protein n=1 Tax=Acetobacter persici TaxID=1076596 RepID=UPI0039EB3A6D
MKLIKLNSGYHLRRWVPLDLRRILGKNEIWHTLETHDKEIAKIRGCAIFGLTSQFFTVVRHRIMINKNSYIYDKTTSLIDNLDTDHDKIILSKIIETYENLVKELKAQQRISEAEALLTRMQDYDR